MLKIKKVIFPLLCLFACVGCGGKANPQQANGAENSGTKPPILGSRIAWDFSTMRRVSPPEMGARYNGYARVIQLHDKSLMCVYEAGGNVVVVKSQDLGHTWSGPVVVAAKPSNYNNANPEILQLKDKSILVSYNPRPQGKDPSRKFEIRTKKSYDGGATWREEQLLYQAGHEFENGCWEPAALQLPSGEIQLFFANEAPYTSSEEQNISLLRSHDNGATWTKNPEVASFRAGKRDGMPSPLLLQNGQDIVVAIEDNGKVQFKPYIVRTSLAHSWATPVTGRSPNRNYALTEPVGDSIYAGAPYIRQLKNGETILSYQGTEGRKNHMNTSEMKVVMGTSDARDFNRKTAPFPIPGNSSGLWNSLCVLEDNIVIALTTTRGFSKNGTTEVWMIKGHVIDELAAKRSTITVDGAQEENAWSENFPVFVGHQSETQLRSQFTYDDDFLYVLSKVKDAKVITNSDDPAQTDGVILQVDAASKSYERPDRGVYSFFVSSDGKIAVKEGAGGQWVANSAAAKVKYSSKIMGDGYVQELAIPWSLLGGKPSAGARMGVNIVLSENSESGKAGYRESISGNNADQPYTWMTLKLK